MTHQAVMTRRNLDPGQDFLHIREIWHRDALVLSGRTGKEAGICLPASGNRADEVRWAFMKWAHRNFELRGEPAAHGLYATLKAEFPCN